MRQHFARITITGLILFNGLTTNTGAQQQGVKCPSDDVDSKAPAYRIGLAAHATKGSRELYLYVSVDASHFVRQDMLLLAQRLNDDFCYEKRLIVVLLDDYQAARHPLRNSKAYWNAERGIYHLNRNTGRQYIKFSTSREKPKDEVVIELKSAVK